MSQHNKTHNADPETYKEGEWYFVMTKDECAIPEDMHDIGKKIKSKASEHNIDMDLVAADDNTGKILVIFNKEADKKAVKKVLKDIGVENSDTDKNLDFFLKPENDMQKKSMYNGDLVVTTKPDKREYLQSLDV